MKTHLDYAYENETSRKDQIWLTQPLGKGDVRDFRWGEAMAEARKMAAFLVAKGLPPGSSIALFSKNTAWWILADIAIWMAGHVTIPLYPTLASETIRQILEHSETRLVMVGKLDDFDSMKAGLGSLPLLRLPLAPDLVAKGGPHVDDWESIMATTAPMTGNPTRGPDDVVTIVYTSGSTGQPKGVMHSFRTMASGLTAIHEYGITDRDRMLSYLPLAHVMERATVQTLAVTVPIHVYFAESLTTFVEDLRRARPTMFASVPRLWLKFQQGVFAKLPPKRLALLLKIPIVRSMIRKKVLGGLGLGDVRFAISGSAPIPAELLDWYRSLGLEVLEGYGMTENFTVSHATKLGEVRVGYVGTTRTGVEQKLSPEGEILVKSPGNMLGYYKNDEATREAIDADGFLHTGDRGAIDEKGRLKITGRVKELFKTSKGKYVAPAPIENSLLLHDDVEQALVSGPAMPQPFGLVVLSDAARARAGTPEQLAALTRSLEAHLEELNRTLDPHEQLEKLIVTRDVWSIENGMLTPTLKLKRIAIEQRYLDRVDAWYAAKERILWD